MNERDGRRIADILEAAEQIAAIVAEGGEAYGYDTVRQLAVERLLEIVGEAARAMTDGGRAKYPDVPWSDIVGLRTLLAHHYQRVDPAQVWVIASESIPELVSALRRQQ